MSAVKINRLGELAPTAQQLGLIKINMKKTTNPHVWIVEILHDGYRNKGWRSTAGCKLTKADAIKELKAWREGNPCDQFRLTRYIPTP